MSTIKTTFKAPDYFYPQDTDDNYDLFDANSLEDLKKIFKEKKFDVKLVRDKDNQTLLHKQCSSAIPNYDIVKWLIEKDVDVNSQDKHGDTPAHLALTNKPELLFDLLFNGVQVVNTDIKSGSYDKNIPQNVKERADYLFNHSPFFVGNEVIETNKCIIDYYNNEKERLKTYNPADKDTIISNCQNKINSIIPKYFKKYKIEKISGQYNITVICYNNSPNKFTIDEKSNSIYIDYIFAPCNNNLEQKDVNLSGTQILRKIINIANELNIKNITLDDESEKRINDCSHELDFAYLNIMLRGQSWYNTSGFVYKYFKRDKTYNETILNMIPEKFFELLKEDEDIQVGDIENFEKLIDDLKIDKKSYKTIKGLFKTVYETSLNTLDKKKMCEYISIISLFLSQLSDSGFLRYYRSLKYDEKYDTKKYDTKTVYGGSSRTKKHNTRKSKMNTRRVKHKHGKRTHKRLFRK